MEPNVRIKWRLFPTENVDLYITCQNFKKECQTVECFHDFAWTRHLSDYTALIMFNLLSIEKLAAVFNAESQFVSTPLQFEPPKYSNVLLLLTVRLRVSASVRGFFCV